MRRQKEARGWLLLSLFSSLSSQVNSIPAVPGHCSPPEMEDRLAVERLLFEVNGERFEIPEIDPSTTLLEFLRTRTRFKSVKLGCGEGGCGACVVLLSKYDAQKDRVESFTISSCLTLVCSLNGCSVTTSDGIGNTKDGFHPIHKRFAGFHASQCGFCTPGMCISLFSALADAESRKKNSGTPGFSNLNKCEAEKAVAGNLCRCTGYRPIADACKSFAGDVDLEDLGINSFYGKGEERNAIISRLPPYNPTEHVSPYVQVSRDFFKPIRILTSEKHSWFTPLSVEELRNMLCVDLQGNGGSIKLVVGNTGDGYYKEVKKYDKYIDLRYIPELSSVRENETGIQVGAAVTISKVILYLKDIDLSRGGDTIFSKVAEHMEKIASIFVRNAGSLGGNIVMAQRKNFPSDVATLLVALSSHVTLMNGDDCECISLEEFFAGPPMDFKTVLLSIHIPFPKPFKVNGSLQDESKMVIETYRAAPRPLGNALPYLTASFLADVSLHNQSILVNKMDLIFGSYAKRHPVRARKTEEALMGNILSFEVLYNAINLVKSDIIHEEGMPNASYTSSLATGFLFEFVTSLLRHNCPSLGKLYGFLPETSSNKRINSRGNLIGNPLLSSSKQVVESSEVCYPVGKPMEKSGALIQASGEAVFVDDIPSPPNCLEGALVYSTKPSARIKRMSFHAYSPHVAVISAKDIPKEGKNVGSVALFGPEPLFAEGVSRFAGDLIALVVAETRRDAYLAAKSALIEYDTNGLEPPILSVEEAVQKSSFFGIPQFIQPMKVGDFSKGMAEADQTILSAEIRLGSQYYFYVETQTALAVPDEDHSMVVYTSIQCPENAHRAISKCIGVPDHNVRVITRRVGGGFGGKALKAMPIATVCALAAHTLHRPVRIYLDRKTDMVIAGGRHPMKVTYTVGFKLDGKITALHLDILIDAGITPDISPAIPNNMIAAVKKYNWGALSFDVKVCKTNRCSKSAMRGPGEVQGSYIAEAIIEHVASVLSLEADSVRTRNLHTHASLRMFYRSCSEDPLEYTLVSIWDKVARSVQFEKRQTMIREFNNSSIWRKRGISRVPVVYELTVRPTPGKVSILTDGSVVVEVGGIELGQGLWTKVRQVAAYALSAIACDGTEDLVDKVRVVQADTLSLIQGGFTAGSTTSESSCEAVRLCCNVLVERLAPLKEKLQEKMGTVTWDALVLHACYQSINLAANSMFLPDPDSTKYLNFGAAVSEVEVNILTGETTFLSTSIVYDCGQSMNPAVDIGQIEGAFVQGIGFFMLEEYNSNGDGLVVADGTWTYKIPTMDTIPKQLDVELINSGRHRRRVLSSKASGEPPLLLAASVHCATRAAITAARQQLRSWGALEGTDPTFQLEVPATMPAVKKLCGLDAVEAYLLSQRELLSSSS